MKTWKKLLALCLMPVILLSLAACGPANAKVSDSATTDTADKPDWGVTLSLKDVTPQGATLIIDRTDGEFTGTLNYGYKFGIDVLKDGKWEKLPYRSNGNTGFFLLGMELKEGATEEVPLNFTGYFGELSPGKYRVVKSFDYPREPGDYDTQEFYAEFDIG